MAIENDETLLRETEFGRIRIQLEPDQSEEDGWGKTIICLYPNCTYRTKEKNKQMATYLNIKKLKEKLI